MNEGMQPGSDEVSSDTQPIETPPPAAAARPADDQAQEPTTPSPAAAPVPPPAAPVPPPAAPAPAAPVAWSSTPTVTTVRGGRTGLAAAAGVALLVLGVIGALIGLLIAFVGGFFTSLNIPEIQNNPDLGPNGAGIVGGIVTFIGIVILVYSLAYFVAGLGVLRTREWGRVTGIVVGIISGLFWLAGLSGGRGGFVFALVLLLIHLYIVVVLAIRWREPVATTPA